MNRREVKFLVIAGLLHLALPVAAAVVPRPASPLGSYVELAPVQRVVDIDVATTVPLRPERRLPRPSSEANEPPKNADAADTPTPPGDGRPAGTPPPEKNIPDAASSVDVPQGESPKNAGKGTSDIDRPPSVGMRGEGLVPGLPGAPIWRTVPGALPDKPVAKAAPTAAPRRKYDKRAATKAIEKGMRKKDRKLGLDFPGASAIAAVLRSAVRAADTPYKCSGSFSVMVSSGGKVTSVSLNGFSGGDSGTWQHVRKSALAALAGKTFPLKSGFAKGAIVAVTVRSSIKKPGGGTARKGATLSFDVTDIGAKAIRVVSVGFSSMPVK